jgi:hypothetical protein
MCGTKNDKWYEKATVNHAFGKMDSRCGLGLRYRSVNIRDVNCARRNTGNQGMNWWYNSKYKLSYKEWMRVHSFWLFKTFTLLTHTRFIFPTSDLWLRINCPFVLNTLIFKIEISRFQNWNLRCEESWSVLCYEVRMTLTHNIFSSRCCYA